MEIEKSTNPLWTKDFTIITIGSVISMLGNALSGLGMSLLVLDYTGSNLYYAIYIAVFTLPQIIMPILSGPILDRFSRKRIIYSLDFLSALLYALVAFLLGNNWFNFSVLAVYCFLVGSINSIYTVAYQSFYPLLITEGNYSKAYSISSVLETMTMIMIPVSTVVYNAIGITPLLAFNAISFFVAAIMETRITTKEGYIDIQKDSLDNTQNSGQIFLKDIKDGLFYLLEERGLLAVTAYFTIASVGYGASSVITLPYFKENYPNGEYVYIVVWGMAVLGRAIGGFLHYRKEISVKYKYSIALVVYIAVSLAEGYHLFFSIPIMMILCFSTGILGVTSYTIRLSATQSYVPDEKKGRFNGAFNMLYTSGTLLGEVLAGVLTVYMSSRVVLAMFMTVTAISAVIIIGGGKKVIEPIYNTQQ